MASRMRRLAASIALVCVILVSQTTWLLAATDVASGPDWSEGATVPPGGRPNPYGSPDDQFNGEVIRGKIHAQNYPVDVTGALPPYRPLANIFESASENPLLRLFERGFEDLTGVRSIDDVFRWVGLQEYPEPQDPGVYSVPYPDGHRPDHRMGVGFIETQDGTGFTLSCAECHASNLFGKTVLGLTNRFPRANETFVASKLATQVVTPEMFRDLGGATEGEARMFERLRENLKSVGAKKPQVLGLDTSLPQVALSLARRGNDDYATKSVADAANPRPEPLAHDIADSKPAVWWNLKYKNRWLSDGSVVSGNPIFTNILWNEIGRGGDLHELEDWFSRNGDVIRELTSAVFSSEAPRFTDFFPAESLALDRAKRGESTFNARCSRCHGVYEKTWSQPGSDALPLADQLATIRVRYPSRTFVVDVGTDPGRYLGMRSLEKGLNPLAISRNNGIVIRAQKGYVPPPLVGIWARWPYFHNNSVPSLCDVLTRHEDRPASYYAGEALDPGRDFDSDCNGYPRGRQVPLEWKERRSAYFDTKLKGLSNEGHDEGIFLEGGQEQLTSQEKSDLIVFLQTL